MTHYCNNTYIIIVINKNKNNTFIKLAKHEF